MRSLRGVRYTVRDLPTRRRGRTRIDVEQIIANGKLVGTIETERSGKTKKSRTCSRKLDTCKTGRDLVWLLEVQGLMGARRRR